MTNETKFEVIAFHMYLVAFSFICWFHFFKLFSIKFQVLFVHFDCIVSVLFSLIKLEIKSLIHETKSYIGLSWFKYMLQQFHIAELGCRNFEFWLFFYFIFFFCLDLKKFQYFSHFENKIIQKHRQSKIARIIIS